MKRSLVFTLLIVTLFFTLDAPGQINSGGITPASARLQATTPGVAQVGNINIDGTIICGSQILGEALGAELVPAIPAAIPSANWTGEGAASWDIVAGKWHHVTGDNTNLVAATGAAVVGALYKITYTVSDRTAGTVNVKIGAAVKPAVSGNGTYVEYHVASSVSTFTIDPSSDFVGDLSGLSAKLVTYGTMLYDAANGYYATFQASDSMTEDTPYIMPTALPDALSGLYCSAEGVWSWAIDPDEVVGNEITNVTNATLTRSGSGTTGAPYTVGLNLANANTWTAAQTFTNTDITHTGSLGTETIAGGDFATATCGVEWTCGAGWTIGAGVATRAATVGTLVLEAATTAIVSGNWYKLGFDVPTLTASTITPSAGGWTGAPITVAGTGYVAWFYATATTALKFTATNTTAGTVDNVTLKQVTGIVTHTNTAPFTTTIAGINRWYGSSVVSTPQSWFSGAWYSGAAAKPHVLIEPSNVLSTGWSTSGTGLGINAPSGFAGNLIDLQTNAVSKFSVSYWGVATIASNLGVGGSVTASSSTNPVFTIAGDTDTGVVVTTGNTLKLQAGGTNGISCNANGVYENVLERTITPALTTGNQTIDKIAGTVNIAAAGTTVTVTNSKVTANSLVFCTLRTADADTWIKNVVVPAAGSFVITLGAAAAAEVSIGFLVTN